MAAKAKSKAKAKAKAKAVAIAALDERQLFHILRPTLIGNKGSPLRTKKLVNKDIQAAARIDPALANIIKTHTLAIVSSSARGLIRKNVFVSDEAAECYFPGLFDGERPTISYSPTSMPDSPPLLPPPPGFEPEVPPDESSLEQEDLASLLDEVEKRSESSNMISKQLRPFGMPSKLPQSEYQVPKPLPSAKLSSTPPKSPPAKSSPPPASSSSSSSSSSHKTPLLDRLPKSENTNPFESAEENSPFSLYIPFVAQHYLLTQIQRILERACLHFAQRALPDLLRRNHWDCVEAIELDVFIRALTVPRNMLMLQKAEKEHPTSDVPQQKSLDDLLLSVALIRHLTVHRRRMTVDHVEQILVDGDRFSRILAQSGPQPYHNVNSDPCVKRITILRKSARSSFRQLRCDKMLMDARLSAGRVQFTNERAEINRREKELTLTLLSEYTKCQEHLTGQLYWSLWHGRSLAAWMRLTWLSWRKHLRSAYLWRT